MDVFDQLWDESYLRKEVLDYFGEFDEDRWILNAGLIADEVGLTNFTRDTPGYVYQAAWNAATNAEKDKYTAIRSVATERELGRILDYGCGIGSGVITLALAGKYVIGAEVNKHCLEFLGKRIRRFGLQQKAVMLDLHTGPTVEDISPFSMVVCTEVFEHLQDPHNVARELIGSLKVGGTAILSWSFVPMPGHLPQHFHLQAPHPDDLLTMGFGKFLQDDLGMEFEGYSWFNNMIWRKE